MAPNWLTSSRSIEKRSGVQISRRARSSSRRSVSDTALGLQDRNGLGLHFPECRYIIIRSMARKSDGGPASDPEVLILSSLAGGAKHGYGIMLDISAFSGIALGPGTLYSAITRLVENGWIEPEETHGRQRPYRLTSRGLQHLQEQLERMRSVANMGLRRLRTA